MHKSTTIILLFVILLAAFLGIFKIDKESLFVDEAASIFYARQPLGKLSDFTLLQGHFPPYFALLHYWIKLFGHSLFSVRFLSFIFYLLSVFLVFKLSELLFDNYVVALISSVIFTTSIVNIYYAQEVRMYSMNVFFSLLSFILLIKFFKRSKDKYLFFYTIITLIMVSLHFFNTLIFLVQIFYVFTVLVWLKNYRFNEMIRKYTLCIIPICLLSLYCFFLLKHDQDPNALKALNEPKTFIDGFASIVNYFSFDIPYKLIVYEKLTNARRLLGFLLMVILFSYGSFVHLKKNKNIGSFFLCTYWFFIPIFIIVLASVVGAVFGYYSSGIFIKPRYVITSSIPYYMLIANGISRIKNKYLLVLSVVVLCIISVPSLTQYYNIRKKSDWKEAFEYVNNRILNSEITICITDERRTKIPMEFYVFKYYSKYPFQLIDLNTGKLISNNPRINGVWQLGWNMSESPRYMLEKFLDNKFNIEEVKQIDNIKIFHFKRNDL